MTARTHDLAAMTALGIVFLLQPAHAITLSTAIVSVFACMVGGITPDIDQPTAPFWRNLPVGKYFGRIFDLVSGGHRFLTHSLLGVAIAGFLAKSLLIFLSPIMPHTNVDLVWWAFLIGIISHLFMDSFTKEGVPWLLPIPVKFGFPPVKKLRITTGKSIETLIVFPGLLIFNLLFYWANYNQILTLLHKYIK